MSMDDWLRRLGLPHLKDKPTELRAALEEAIAKNIEELQSIRDAAEARLRALERRDSLENSSDDVDD